MLLCRSGVGMCGSLLLRGGPRPLTLGRRHSVNRNCIVIGRMRMDQKMDCVQAMAGTSKGAVEVGEVAIQQGVKVGFQGKPGAYSELACQRAFPGCSPYPCGTFDAVFEVCIAS